jgi:uncharacterized protein YecE (DUF72 family)
MYLRFIGDRSIPDSEFGKIQKDRVNEMQYWAKQVKKVEKKLRRGVVAANNHYAGFGPGTANIFLKMLDKPERTWHDTGHVKQKSLLDFSPNNIVTDFTKTNENV